MPLGGSSSQGQVSAMTPVLQSRCVALITASKRHRFLLRGRPKEEKIEVPFYTLVEAEEVLLDLDAGSVVVFVHSEPCQTSRGSSCSSSVSSSGRRHSLYVSFRYRRNVIHYENNLVELRELCKEGLRRPVFHAEQKQFELTQELVNNFVPCLKSWLAAIVKTANFIDQPVESVDLQALLTVRHHAILTRRTSQLASVVLCKMDHASTRIVSVGIVFDFQELRVRDDENHQLRSFQEVFQQFIGLHPGTHSRQPSPREDEDNPQLTLGLLEGLDTEAEAEQRLQKLLKLQLAVRQNQRGFPEESPDPQLLELVTTLLLPQLVHAVASQAGSAGATATTEGILPAAVAGTSSSAEQVLCESLGELEILVCDILAELCDLHINHVGPHVWRLFRGYLEDAERWNRCLLALTLLTLMSDRLAEWLVLETDAPRHLFGLLVQVQERLMHQREETLAATGRMGRLHLPPGQLKDLVPSLPRPVAKDLTGPREPVLSGHRRMGSGGQPPRGTPNSSTASRASPMKERPFGVQASPRADTPLAAGSRERYVRGDPQASDRSSEVGATPHSQRVGHMPMRGDTASSPSIKPRLARMSSFDSFDAFPAMPFGEQSARALGNMSSRSYEVHPPDWGPPPELPQVSESEVSEVATSRTTALRHGEAAGEAESRNARPTLVPKLNLVQLDAASKLAGGTPSSACTGQTSEQRAGADTPLTRSSTRSTRRLQTHELRKPVPVTQGSSGLGSAMRSPPGGAGTASSWASLSTSISAPILGVGKSLVNTFNQTCNQPSKPATGAVPSSAVCSSTAEDSRPLQRCDELADALGEACLLTDLGPLLRMKQETQVHAAVEAVAARDSSGQASARIQAPSAEGQQTSARLGQGGTPGTSSVPQSPAVSRQSSTHDGASSIGRVKVLTTAEMSGTPREGRANSVRLTTYRRVRLQVCLVLERLATCSPQAGGAMGKMPVNYLFKMMQASCSRSGAYSFAFDGKSSADSVSGINSLPAPAAALESRTEPRPPLRANLRRLANHRARLVSQLEERLCVSASSRRCVCGVESSRADDHCNSCTCVDDALATCIWQLLVSHALEAEKRLLARSWPVPAPGCSLQDNVGKLTNSAASSETDPGGDIVSIRPISSWHQMLGQDALLERLGNAIQDALTQLKTAQSAATAGPEVVTSLQHRLTAVLRFCSAYLERSSGRILAVHAFRVLQPQMVSLKLHLHNSLGRSTSSGLEAGNVNVSLTRAALRLWAAYLQLVGTMLLGAARGSSAIGHLMLDQLLDFPTHMESCRVKSGSSGNVPQTTRSSVRSHKSPSTPSPTRSRPTRLSQDGQDQALPTLPRRADRGCASTSSLGSLATPAQFTLASPASSPAQASSLSTRRLAMPSSFQAPGAETAGGGLWHCLPRVLDRILCDPGGNLEEASGQGGAAVGSARSRNSAADKFTSRGSSEDGLESVRARIMGFVKAIIEFATVLNGARVPSSDHTHEGNSLANGQIGLHDDSHTETAAQSAVVKNILEWLSFLFQPPGGLFCKLAQKLPIVSSLTRSLISCECSLFRVPAVAETVFARDPRVPEYYVRRHFLGFVRLYNRRPGDSLTFNQAECIDTCRLHLETLLAMAGLQSEGDGELPRRAFHQFFVLDFLAGEIDLEHETTQMRDRFMRKKRQGRGGGGGSSTASSSLAAPNAAPAAPPQHPPPNVQIQATLPPFKPLAGADMQGKAAGPLTLGAGVGGPKRAPVPALRMKGLRPSLQGCSGLGAPPPEEPGVGDQPGFNFAQPPLLDGESSRLTPPSSGDGSKASGLEHALLPPLAPVLDAPDSSDDDSPLTSPSRMPSKPETEKVSALEPQRPPLPSLPKLSMPPSGQRAQGSTFDESTAQTLTLVEPHSTPPELQGQFVDSSDEDSDKTPTAKQASLPAMALPLPRPPVLVLGKSSAVPKLSFSGLRPSLQGCSGLGAPPPEEPGQEFLRNQATELPAMEAAAAENQDNNNMGQEAPEIVDSSDEDSDRSTPAREVPLPPTGLPLARPPVPVLGKSSAVPKLSFSGLRPSLQGCSGLGAPPPEEPGQELLLAQPPQPLLPSLPALPGPTGGHVLPPLPASDSSDSDTAKQVPAPEQPQAASEQVLDSSDEDSDCGLATALPPANESPIMKLPPTQPTHGLSPQLPREEVFHPKRGASLTLHSTAPKVAVPKLGFQNVRASMQGTAFMGAPPPEEPQPPPPAPTELQHHATPSRIHTPEGSGCRSPAGSLTTASAHGAAPPLLEANDLSCAGIVHQNIFYFEGRQRRRIYEDVELHALMLTLILALLLTPKRQLLDSRYCDQYPLQRNQRNIPFLLSVHLNHSANKSVLPWVFQQVDSIGRLGELRLLKLFCETAMHRWMYTNMRIIGSGQFGTVFQSNVALASQNTTQVAIKQIPKQAAIKDRCVFFDVFNEILCMDNIRFEDNVCHVCDFGVDECNYWIVMKWYSSSLKKWRDTLPGSMSDHLPVLLAVFKQILKAVWVLHRQDIVHYDLKCDNVMIEAVQKTPEETVETPSTLPPGMNDPVPRIALVDFGESRMLAHAEELDMRNRGTEIIKGPEMLELHVVASKHNVAHDRRKRVGTHKAADIWSLGCIFFEVLTGRFLFQDYDFGTHWACITGKSNEDVVNEDNVRRLGGSAPLIEYIRYLLVRDPLKRPTIEAAMKKFETIAIDALAGTGREVASDPESPSARSMARPVSGTDSPDSPRSVALSLGGSSAGGLRSRRGNLRPDRPLACAAAGKDESYFAKVLNNLYVLEVSDEDLLGGHDSGAWGALKSRLGQRAWTHLVDFRMAGAQPLPFHVDLHVLQLPWKSAERGATEFLGCLPVIFDFLRHAALLHGVVLFVDGYSKVLDDSRSATASTARGGGGGSNARRGGLAMSAVLALVTETYQMGVYAALSYLSSQMLVAALRPDAVAGLAHWQEDDRFSAWGRCANAVRVACLCGSCCWFVPAAWLQAQNCDGKAAGDESCRKSTFAEKLSCACSHASGGGDSRCPNRGGCESYIRWLQARCGVSISSVRWLYLPKGVSAADCNSGPGGGVIARGLAEQAELVEETSTAEPGKLNWRRFRCRSCKVLTHAEVEGPDAVGGSIQTALVSSYELVRCRQAQVGQDPSAADEVADAQARLFDGSQGMLPSCFQARPRRPPKRLPITSLAQVSLPVAQPAAKDLL